MSAAAIEAAQRLRDRAVDAAGPADLPAIHDDIRSVLAELGDRDELLASVDKAARELAVIIGAGQ